MRVILLSGDLMVVSSAQGAADRHGVDLVVARDAEAAAAASVDAARLVAVDLRTPGVDIESLAAKLRGVGGENLSLMAFGPHVHEASLARAAAAGCDEVVTRGEFERRFDVALAQLSSENSGTA